MNQSPPLNMGPVTEFNRNDKHLTNHQRLKDREMQRAFDAGVELPFLPTKSRAKRAGTTQKRLIEEYRDAHRLPVSPT